MRNRRLVLLFVVTTLIPAAGLVWLGLRMAEQDRALERQRVQERRNQAADLAAALLERTLANLDDKLATRSVPKGAALVIFGAQGLEEHDGIALPYYPLPPHDTGPGESAAFEQADALEFQKHDFEGAIRALERPAVAQNPETKASALVRLARNYQHRGELEEALATYQKLSLLDGTDVNGV